MHLICTEAPRDVFGVSCLRALERCGWCSAWPPTRLSPTAPAERNQQPFLVSGYPARLGQAAAPASSEWAVLALRHLVRQIQNKSVEEGEGTERRSEETSGGRWEGGGILMQEERRMREECKKRRSEGLLILQLELLYFPSTAKTEEAGLIYISAHVGLPAASGGYLISHNWRDGFFKTSLWCEGLTFVFCI